MGTKDTITKNYIVRVIIPIAVIINTNRISDLQNKLEHTIAIKQNTLSGNCKYVWNDVYCLQRTPPCLSEYVVCWYFNYTSFYRGCLSFVQYFGFAHL